MNTMYERRLDNVVPVGNIGVGETVHIKTLMGAPVCHGEVVSSNPFGVVVKEGEGGASSFYDSKLYLFSVLEPDIPVVAVGDLSGMTPDERVAHKLKPMTRAKRMRKQRKKPRRQRKRPRRKPRRSLKKNPRKKMTTKRGRMANK